MPNKQRRNPNILATTVQKYDALTIAQYNQSNIRARWNKKEKVNKSGNDRDPLDSTEIKWYIFFVSKENIMRGEQDYSFTIQAE